MKHVSFNLDAHRAEDVERIRRLAAEAGYEMDARTASEFWGHYSDDYYSAGWYLPGPDDDHLRDKIVSALEAYARDGTLIINDEGKRNEEPDLIKVSLNAFGEKLPPQDKPLLIATAGTPTVWDVGEMWDDGLIDRTGFITLEEVIKWGYRWAELPEKLPGDGK